MKTKIITFILITIVTFNIGIININIANASNSGTDIRTKIHIVLSQKLYSKIERKIKDNHKRELYLDNLINKLNKLKETKFKNKPKTQALIDLINDDLIKQSNIYRKKYIAEIEKQNKKIKENAPKIDLKNIKTATKQETLKWNTNGGTRYAPNLSDISKVGSTSNLLKPLGNVRNSNFGVNDAANFKANPYSQEFVKMGGWRIDANKVVSFADGRTLFRGTWDLQNPDPANFNAKSGLSMHYGQILYGNWDGDKAQKLNNIVKDFYKKIGTFKANPNEAKLPIVAITGKSTKEIQEITQRYNTYNASEIILVPEMYGHFVLENHNGIQFTASLGSSDARNTDTQHVIMNPAADVYKYGFLINGTINKGTQKYEDYKKDYFRNYRNEKFSGYTDNNARYKVKEYAVKLEPLKFSSNIANKIKYGKEMTSSELLQAWKSAIKQENLGDLVKIEDAGNKYYIMVGDQSVFSWYKNKTKALNPKGDAYIMQINDPVQFFFYR